MKFYIDEKLLFEYTKEAGAGKDSWPFDDEFNIIINTAVGGDWVKIYFFNEKNKKKISLYIEFI